ncbi:MAG TPA: DUF4440 domain-containing protein [Kofleriaceae bacterium]|nr:DUF4440 domain-containing protein [Kofleriaceae bacterium]
MRALALSIAVAACGGSPPPTTGADGKTPPPPAARVDVQGRFGWLVGHWANPRGGFDVVAAGDALFVAGFAVADGRTVHAEAAIIHDADGAVVFDSSAGGAPMDRSTLSPRGSDRVVAFLGKTNGPSSITFARDDDTLRVEMQSPGDAAPMKDEFVLAPAARAPELEAADRRWNDDVGARGVDAWVDAFDADGVQQGGGGDHLTTSEARRKAMEPVLAASFRLIWTPVASGLSLTGDLGFTVGTWHYDAGTVTKARGAYLTLWKRQADGGWKVLWDGGDPEG